MGWFSGKKKTYVESMTLKLVEDTPNYVQQSVLTSIRQERPIVDDLNANLIRGLGAQLTSYYKYGRDKYYYGLPEGSMVNRYAASNTVKLVIESELDKPIYLVYAVFGAPDANLFAEDYLINTRGYNKETGDISKPLNPGATKYISSTFLSDTSIRITYESTIRYTEDITVPKVNLSSQYYHASYYLFNEFGEVVETPYWWFHAEAGTKYDVLKVSKSTSSPYYPVVPLRHNNKDFTEDDGSERYNTSRNLLRKLKLDIKQLGEGINSNPDIGDIDHAYVFLGVSPDTKSPIGKKYLFHYFKYLGQNAIYKKSDFASWNANTDSFKRANTPPSNLVVIKDNDISYHIELGFIYIDVELKNGVIGKLKTYSSEIQIKPSQEYADYGYSTSVLILRNQINKTQYEEVVVFGPRHIDYVYGSKTIDTDLADILDKDYDKDNFLVPLHHGVVEAMGMVDKTELVYDSLRIGFHCIVHKKLKWYQTGFFKIVTLVVAIAITIASMGSLSGTLGAAAGLVGSTSLVIGALVLATINIGVQFGVAYLVDVLGIELGGILAMAAALFAAYGGNIIPPETLSAIQSGITKGLDIGIQGKFKSIAIEMEQMKAEMYAQEQELEKLMEEYQIPRMLDPMAQHDSVTGLALPWETPSMYYNTRIHMGNMASVSYMGVENYVSSALKLEGVTTHHGI